MNHCTIGLRARRLLPALVGALLLLACDQGPGQAARTTSSSASAHAPSSASALPSATATASAGSAAGVDPRQAGPYNVMLLTIDAMRADMPWQGYERPIAPFLTELAKQSVVYTNAYSISSYTAKSVGALLSGRYPSTLYRSGYFFTAYPDANVFFPELLQKAGVRTIGIQAHKYFDRGMKLDQGFDVWKLPDNLKWHAETDENVTSPQLTDIAIELLSKPENTSKPFFFWMHYGDPHDQYFLHEECPRWGRDNRDRYDAEICFVDLHVKRLVEWAKGQPWWGTTALIIGSDHGEAFGEHGQWKHAFALWEVLVHVPLFVHLPGATARTISERRSYIDLPATIMDLLGQPVPAEFMGKSLRPELLGAPPDVREPIVMELPADSHNPPTFAIIEGKYKLHYEGAANRFRLYDLAADPAEQSDLAKVKSASAELERMKQLYEQTRAKIPSIKPYGSNKLVGGGRADGPEGPG